MIADASNEQASAISQINEGVEQISQVTQTNMATAEESASASEELASHAMLLKQLIDEFKLKRSENAKKKLPTVKKNPIKKNNFSREVEISLEDDDFGKY
jgi:methyl-accepting chemotaxis protein